jgi:hypothetical protein
MARNVRLYLLYKRITAIKFPQFVLLYCYMPRYISIGPISACKRVNARQELTMPFS